MTASVLDNNSSLSSLPGLAWPGAEKWMSLDWKKGFSAEVTRTLDEADPDKLTQQLIDWQLKASLRNAKSYQQPQQIQLNLLRIFIRQIQPLRRELIVDGVLQHLCADELVMVVDCLQKKLASKKQKEKSRSRRDREMEEIWQQLLFCDTSVQPQEMSADLIPLWGCHVLLQANFLLLAGPVITPQLYLSSYLQLLKSAQYLTRIQELPQPQEQQPWQVLLLRGELPYLLGKLFLPLKGFSSVCAAGRKVCQQELPHWTDTDGTPHACLLSELPLWAGSFQRMQVYSLFWEENFPRHSQRKLWAGLWERLTGLTDSQGRLLLSTEVDSVSWSEQLQIGLGQLKSNDITPPLRHQLRQRKHANFSKEKSKPGKSKQFDRSAAMQTDWGHAACLRNNWYPGANLLAINHWHPQVPLELSILGTTLFQGHWLTEVVIDQQPILLMDQWAALCWYNEKNCDYLELRLEAGDVTVDRQIFLSRTDHLVILSDTVTTKNSASVVEIEWKLPIASKWKMPSEKSGRDLQLFHQRQQVRMVPLAIEQDVIQKPQGQLLRQEEAIILKQRGQQSVCQPLLIDWSPERKKEPVDWARLTVTQDRKILAPHQVFAARARIGSDQWLYLRNLEFSGWPRAVLGMHTDAETIIADLDAKGHAERLVEVHYEEEDELCDENS